MKITQFDMEKNVKEKVGNIFKISYQPEFSIGFKAFCKTYVPGVFEIDDKETNQYHTDTIVDKIEEFNYELSDKDKELLLYLIETEKIEYIEF